MEKIISLFKRDYEGDHLVYDEVVPGAEWVQAGEGVATRKWDGTCCLVRDGELLRRLELKRGREAPAGFEPTGERDPVTTKTPGWAPVASDPSGKWLREALANVPGRPADGTYEACGPKIGSRPPNPEGLDRHVLIRHGADVLEGVPRDFEGLSEYLADGRIEGIVWHHPDGRMAKIKAKDFGILRATDPRRGPRGLG